MFPMFSTFGVLSALFDIVKTSLRPSPSIHSFYWNATGVMYAVFGRPFDFAAAPYEQSSRRVNVQRIILLTICVIAIISLFPRLIQ